MTDEIRAKVRSIVTENPNSWELCWNQNLKPWDAGAIQPPLREVMESDKLELPDKGRALVPGCGTGYDVAYIATTLKGFDVFGLDVSSTAVEEAKKYLSSQGLPGDSGAEVEFEAGDFFKYTVSDDRKFDLIYDHTFFVAIPPSFRMSWGKQMRSLIKPGGYLITIVYPLQERSEEEKLKGPPFYVEPDHYIEPLGDGWQKVIDKIPERSSPSHEGKERLIVWKRL
ncbi:S-adenosyl-L-methionine-dependent methyltransferase [Dendrothele bispora CBS 962.96]|uniref:S-adenosyl-L-methionine-dependent methyltransferase n=1 Tax=Dendrothele bispora (strain CBS 962.96) TaxID=1314807 RepID=A0A4V4HI48_DENBC|nr:S-adenosyl-L-methionine-dependent methyltransferase [Dendrothele bispora CBS 962.96]